MNMQPDWQVIADAVLLIKSIEPERIKPDCYVGRDLGIDSIGVVDLWFELKKLTRTDSNLNQFYKHIRSDTNREFYNDFTIRELADYLRLKV